MCIGTTKQINGMGKLSTAGRNTSLNLLFLSFCNFGFSRQFRYELILIEMREGLSEGSDKAE